jgi:hypothetical protein
MLINAMKHCAAISEVRFAISRLRSENLPENLVDGMRIFTIFVAKHPSLQKVGSYSFLIIFICS